MQTVRVTERLERVRESLAGVRADWLLLAPSADFVWLTGAHARSTERLVLLAVPARGEPFCVVPRLEADALAAACPWLELEVWEEREDPMARLEHRLALGSRSVVRVGEGLRVAPLLRLAASATCLPAAEVLGPLRVIKDREELELMARAGGHADSIVEQLADAMEPGMTERQLARMAFDLFDAAGDTDAWVIVGSGPNSAVPHHFTSDRKLQNNEVVLLDLGAFTGGYGSDITRTYWLGSPPDGAPAVYEAVRAAQAAGVAASRAGAIPEEVDRAARDVITRAGHGEHFVHRLGHGVGLEVHESPYIVSGNREPLREGMVHSVEPGIYLPGRFGVRIEDLVAVEARGARRLNRAPIDPRPPRLRG